MLAITVALNDNTDIALIDVTPAVTSKAIRHDDVTEFEVHFAKDMVECVDMVLELAEEQVNEDYDVEFTPLARKRLQPYINVDDLVRSLFAAV